MTNVLIEGGGEVLSQALSMHVSLTKCKLPPGSNIDRRTSDRVRRAGEKKIRRMRYDYAAFHISALGKVFASQDIEVLPSK